jgi:hypothetical protein
MNAADEIYIAVGRFGKGPASRFRTLYVTNDAPVAERLWRDLGKGIGMDVAFLCIYNPGTWVLRPYKRIIYGRKLKQRVRSNAVALACFTALEGELGEGNVRISLARGLSGPGSEAGEPAASVEDSKRE